MFDLEILAEYPSFLFENCYENVGLGLLDNKSPNTMRTALSACATDVGEHRKTENELPPPHPVPTGAWLCPQPITSQESLHDPPDCTQSGSRAAWRSPGAVTAEPHDGGSCHVALKSMGRNLLVEFDAIRMTALQSSRCRASAKSPPRNSPSWSLKSRKNLILTLSGVRP